MVFSSSLFLFYFLPIFLLIYTFVDKKFKNYVILGASLFFYSWGAPSFIFILLASTILDFYLVRKMHASSNLKIRKILLGLSLATNLGLLIYFKYSNFFVENINLFFENLGMSQMEWTAVILPIGISFYTFQTLTYSIDIYRNTEKPLDKLSDYLLYIMAFPQMIAGPIVRFNTVSKQILDREDTVDDKLLGFYRFSIGLAKKVLIANVMAEQADLIFKSDLSQLNASSAWIGILAYTFQIYFDFAGYSDMAIGLGRMMGFHFPENFNSPYTAKSISEFWRRWHITLGDFMKNYLYIPLGGNKVNRKSRLYFNLIFVFAISGLWHGASWNFVLWGLFHGTFLILDRLFLSKLLEKSGFIFANLFTFIIVVIGWAIFRLEDLDSLGVFLGKLFSFNFSGDITLIPAFVFILIVAIIFSFISNFKIGKKAELFYFGKETYSLKNHVFLFSTNLILFFLSAVAITSSGFNPFIYFRF